MSADFDNVRKLAVEFARVELGKHVRETGMQNRGSEIDFYLRTAGLGNNALGDGSAQGADARQWCGMFIYFCYLKAATNYGKILPFGGRNLWSGQRLGMWANAHPAAIVNQQSPVQIGDIFTIPSGHVGIAVGAASANGVFPTIEGNQGELNSRYDGIAEKHQSIAHCRLVVRI